MVEAVTRKWTKLTLWAGDGASPEDFTNQTCALNAKEFTITKDMADSIVPDCDDPDVMAWIQREPRSASSAISGSGVMAEQTLAFWRAWALSDDPKNMRIALDLAGTDGYFAGRYHLTSFQLTGNEGDGKIQVSLALASDGPVAWASGAP